ncbi:MAG TPA: (4Fe-4S)-binding protein [bacterium]|nr:(4Fe-4S)-binding protein [bacterium]
MKQIAVISGKGGTGKTMISASFAAIAGKCVIADCDVDAANMHLMLHPEIKETHVFKSGQKGVIDKDKCIECGKCITACRFDAIGRDYIVDVLSCDGCVLCSRICPAGAIEMKESTAGEWFLSDTKYGPFAHARLGIAEDNSGKLVAKVRQAAEVMAGKTSGAVTIIDGPPGTGCPVMASITGVDFAVIVTEPTVSGIHDLKRAADVVAHFRIKTGVIVNKYDINEEKSAEIAEYCKKENVFLLGKVPFSRMVVDAVNAGIPPVLWNDEKVKNALSEAWKNVKNIIK